MTKHQKNIPSVPFYELRSSGHGAPRPNTYTGAGAGAGAGANIGNNLAGGNPCGC